MKNPSTVTPELMLSRLLVENVQDYAIFMLDPGGHVMTWNRGAERIKGYTAQEILGKHFSCFYPDEDVKAGKCETELATALRDGRYEDEGWRLRKDGSRFWANVVITPLRDDGRDLLGFAKVTRDLTERRAAEEERIRLAQSQEAVRLRDEFLSIASHELRTPLTGLTLQVQALSSAALEPKIAKKIHRIERTSSRLQTLMEVMLDVSRIAKGRFILKKSQGDLVAMTREVIDRLAEQASDAGCVVTFDARIDSVVGQWDLLRLEQAMTNLIENSVKYGPGKPIRVTIGLTGSSPNEATITVEDGGPGIPDGDRERIFGRFERAASTRHHGGLGLGLYVAREIVSGHGGTITADSSAGGGARLVVRLPVPPGMR